jgi:hypothetical protein
LRRPFLPCILVYGGGRHRSFYPLEFLNISSMPNPNP